jgi:hypothetical protein
MSARSCRVRSRLTLFEDKKRRCTDVLLSLNVAAFAAQLLSRGALLAWGAKVCATRWRGGRGGRGCEPPGADEPRLPTLPR